MCSCAIFTGDMTRSWENGGPELWRQAAALARSGTLIGNLDILHLYEVTNTFDAVADELAVQNALKRFASERTMIVILGPLSTIGMADQAVVLNCGKLVEKGRSGALQRANRPFVRVFSPQCELSQNGQPELGACALWTC